MSQFNWVVLGAFNRKYNIGLYHGESSGHVVVYCNQKVLIIDFSVKKPKKYSFYLGDELFDLHINKAQEQYNYSLIKNISADTPLNQYSKKKAKWDTIKLVLLTIMLILFIASLMLIINA